MVKKKDNVILTEGAKTSIEEIRKEEIILNIVKLLLINANEIDIVASFKKKKSDDITRNVTKAEIAECILIAKDRIKDLCEDNIEYELRKTTLQLDSLYMHSFLSKDFKTCADILSKKSKILGIGSSNETTQSVSGGVEIIHKYVEVMDRTDVTIDTTKPHEKPPIRLT